MITALSFGMQPSRSKVEMARLTVTRAYIVAGMIDCHQIPALPMTGSVTRASFARALAARFAERILWKCSIDQGLEGHRHGGFRASDLKRFKARETGNGSRFAIALLCTWKSALFVD